MRRPAALHPPLLGLLLAHREAFRDLSPGTWQVFDDPSAIAGAVVPQGQSP